MAEKWNIMLGIPHGGTLTYAAAQGIFRGSQKHNVAICPVNNSALAHGFNQILAISLNAFDRGEITHLAFLHSDIDPADCWIDVLADEMEAVGADFLSVINAIKDARGVTSTGIAKPGDDWRAFRRFTVREVMKLPPTFSSTDVGYPDDILLHNTGCWLANLAHPVFHETNEDGELKAYFTLRDRIYKTSDGTWSCQFEPEDWFYSRRLFEAKAKTFATRKVRTAHLGWLGYVNDMEWGQYLNGDEDTAERWRTEDKTGQQPIYDESGCLVGTNATVAVKQEPELCLTQ